MSERGPVRVTVWGENVHEREEDAVRALYPEGMHATIAAGLAARLGDRRARAHRDAAGARARAHAGGPGRHRRADLVGPHRARPRSTTRWWTASTRRCSAGWACSPCTPRTTRRSSSACSGPRAACAGATTASASWCGPSTPRTRSPPGVPHPIVHRRARDVRRALRHPRARRARVRQLVRGRRGVPRRLLLPPRRRAGSSTSAPATRTTRSTTTPTSSG